jgi:competence protein ComEA
MLKRILAFILMLSAAMAMAAVDVNKATDAELDSVKGIGPVTSKLIISERKKGEFKSWQDFIDRVKGVGEARAAKLSAEGLTVGGATYTAAQKDTKTSAKEDKKSAKEDAKEAKAAAKEEKKSAKATAKEDKATASAEKKDTKATAGSDSAKPAASSAKAAASAKK